MVRTELVTALNSFLRSSISLNELQEWVLSNLQKILDSNDSVTISVVNEVDSDLIGMSEGLLGESTFVENLDGWINRLQNISVRTGESTETILADATTSYRFTVRPQEVRFEVSVP